MEEEQATEKGASQSSSRCKIRLWDAGFMGDVAASNDIAFDPTYDIGCRFGHRKLELPWAPAQRVIPGISMSDVRDTVAGFGFQVLGFGF